MPTRGRTPSPRPDQMAPRPWSMPANLRVWSGGPSMSAARMARAKASATWPTGLTSPDARAPSRRHRRYLVGREARKRARRVDLLDDRPRPIPRDRPRPRRGDGTSASRPPLHRDRRGLRVPRVHVLRTPELDHRDARGDAAGACWLAKGVGARRRRGHAPRGTCRRLRRAQRGRRARWHRPTRRWT